MKKKQKKRKKKIKKWKKEKRKLRFRFKLTNDEQIGAVRKHVTDVYNHNEAYCDNKNKIVDDLKRFPREFQMTRVLF